MAILDSRSRVNDDIPSSSMADIAFLLLIFFLVTTVFPRDRGLPLVLPGPDDEAPVAAENVLHLLVQPTGAVEVRHGDSPQSQRVTASAVHDIWRQNVAARPNLIAAVKTHEDAAYRHMIDVLDALSEAGAQRISLQALPR